MKREVTWAVRPITKYELVRGWTEEDEAGRGRGGTDVLGVYSTEAHAQQALAALKRAEAAVDELQNPTGK